MNAWSNEDFRLDRFFWGGGGDVVNEAPGVGAELLGYRTACPTNSSVRTVCVEDLIVRGTRGGGYNCPHIVRTHLGSVVHAMLLFLAPKPKADAHENSISATVQHLKAAAGVCHEAARRALYSSDAWADWDDDQQREASILSVTGSYRKCVLVCEQKRSPVCQ